MEHAEIKRILKDSVGFSISIDSAGVSGAKGIAKGYNRIIYDCIYQNLLM